MCFEAAVGRIKFNNILFSYLSSGKLIVEKISFTVKGGKTIILVGQSGSGKTIVLNLLQHFINPNKGNIKINS